MRYLDAGSSWAPATDELSWSDLKLDTTWRPLVDALAVGRAPRPVQVQAIRDAHVLTGRRNLLVAAPTNAGKTLVGLFILLDALRRGRRAILLEPLRAIARERAEELQLAAPRLSSALRRDLRVRLTTGDYRLDDETFDAPPPEAGELVIATPERLDAILRDPNHDSWVETIGAVCVDEAHLISSRRRGPTLEYLITRLLCLRSPPRMVLLSASLGDVSVAKTWLEPCDVVSVSGRVPTLHKEVVALDTGDDSTAVVAEHARKVLAEPNNALLVFVYQTAAAQRLATSLRAALGPIAGVDGPLPYHSRMSLAQRQAAHAAFATGNSRCVVATTALSLGVNLPATHVVVRDTTFPGTGRIEAHELLQMMGRAGRGNTPGHAAAFVRPKDGWVAEELADVLRAEPRPELRSSLDKSDFSLRRNRNQDSARTARLIPVASQIAIQLARTPERGLSVLELRDFFDRSLGARAVVSQLDEALRWLTDPARVLAFCESERYRPTALGLSASRAILPLEIASGFAQLLRDLVSLDPTDQLLASWRPLDHLTVLDCLSGRSPQIRPFGEALVDGVDAWMEAHPLHASVLYRQWIRGQKGASRAAEVIGSLGVALKSEGDRVTARELSYVALFRSILLYELGTGARIADLERRWSVSNLEGVEERWRDDTLWLVAGLGKIIDIRTVYFHLRESCGASDERVTRVKHLLTRMRGQTFELQGLLKHCSPLGPMLVDLRASLARKPPRALRDTAMSSDRSGDVMSIESHDGSGSIVGFQTIRRLEEAGVRDIADLAALHLHELVQLGIRRRFARQLYAYARRRRQ
jgi:helicase